MEASSGHRIDPQDARSLDALAGGDRGALAELYDRHASAMLAVAIRILRNRQDAEDLLHDVFVEVHDKAGQYDPARGSVRSWLIVRVRSRAIDRQRSLAVARRHAMARAADAAEPEAELPRSWDGVDQARARRALDGLPEEQRVLVELGYFEGLSHAEMAAHCGIPIGTVKSRLTAALRKLRSALIPPGGAG